MTDNEAPRETEGGGERLQSSDRKPQPSPLKTSAALRPDQAPAAGRRPLFRN
jgi:hypothetical protein